MSRAFLILMLSVMLLVCGCGLFSTRPAEAPTSGKDVWLTPVAAEDVLTNLRTALFDANEHNYMLSFDPDRFQFLADPVTISRDPSVGSWDYASETHHADRLFNPGTLPADSSLLVIFSSQTNTDYGDSVDITALYDFSAGVALVNVPHRMAGRADFWLHKGREGYWQIYRWQDQRTAELSTWSDFKSLLR